MEIAKSFVMVAVIALFGFVLTIHVLDTTDDNQLIQYQVTFIENPTAGQNFTANGQNYTFVNDPSSGYNVHIGSNVNETVYNLKLALQNNTRLVVS